LKRTVPCDFLTISNGNLNCTGVVFEQISLSRIKQLDVVYMGKEFSVSEINESDIKSVNAMSIKKEKAVAAQQRAAQARAKQINRQKRTQLASTEGVDFSHGLPSEQMIEGAEQRRAAWQASRQKVTANTPVGSRTQPLKTDNANNSDDIVTIFKFIALILIIYTVGSVLVSKWKEEDSFRETVKYNLIYYLFSFVAAIFLTLRMDYEFVDHLYLILLATALFCWLWHLLQSVIIEIIGSESVFRAIGIILFVAFFIWSLLNGGDAGPESYWEQQAGN
ncbi:hypothetical protein VU12_09835, partial [Desulfobulbus sp. US4]|nr:hypothetical protein [Desulfobulbus sp. US4]